MGDERARAEIAALGEFFALTPADTLSPADTLAPADAGGPWRSMDALVDGPGLRDRVEATTTALGRLAGTSVQARVGASTASLGLFARLLSPAVGAELLEVRGPSPDGLQWRSVPAGTVPLRATTWCDDSLDRVLSEVVEPLAARLVAAHGLADAVVRGNVASAVVGSLRMAAAARPDLGTAAERLAARLLADPFLTGTAVPGSPFVRRSCCLYYRLPGGGYCGDCILAPQHRERVAADARR